MDIEAIQQKLAAEAPVSEDVWEAFLAGLESGEISTVTRDESGTWHTNVWVKSAILKGFRAGGMKPFFWPPSLGLGTFENPDFFDRPAFPPRAITQEDGIRMVPGGSSIRRGAYVARGVVIMPPAYINVGAHVCEGTMVDSHALVGSCAWIGANVHLSAGVQIGGVLEPPQAQPVIIEDGAFIGGMCGIFEGILVKKNAVLASGVIISRSTKIMDLVNEKEYYGVVPENAVVVPGSRPASGPYAQRLGIGIQTPCIIKYRDEGTSAAVVLETALR